MNPGLLAGVAATFVSLFAAAAAAAQPGDDPNRLFVTSHGATANGTPCNSQRFWHYPSGLGAAVFSDCVAPPPFSESVPVHAGGVVLLETGIRVYKIAASGVRSSGSTSALQPRATDTSGRRFAVTLPDGCAAGRLDVHTYYDGYRRDDGAVEHGDFQFATGMTEHVHQRPLCGRRPATLSARAGKRYAGRALARRFHAAFSRRAYQRRCDRRSPATTACRVLWSLPARGHGASALFRGTVVVSRSDGGRLTYRLRVRKTSVYCGCSRWIVGRGELRS